MKDLRDLKDSYVNFEVPLQVRCQQLPRGAVAPTENSPRHFPGNLEPSLDALSLRSDVISSINILSP